MRKTLPSTRVLAAALVIAGAMARPGSAVDGPVYQPEETLPAQKYDKVFDVTGFDRVNVFSGDLQLTIPIGPEYPVTAGFTFQLSAHYSSKFWHMVKPECGLSELGCGNEWAGRANVIGDSTLGVGWSIGPGYVEKWIPPGEGLPHRWLQSWNGTRQDFGVSLEANDGSDVKMTELPGGGGYVVSTPDGTQWYYTTRQAPPVSVNGYDFQNVNVGEAGQLERWGLASVTDRYGNANVLTVEYLPGGDWRVKEIVLAGNRKITFGWGQWNGAPNEVWPVLSSVSLPAVGGGTVTASFSRRAAAPMSRAFEGGVVQGCTPTGPAAPALPMLGAVSISDQVWTFVYDQGTTGKGTLTGVTIPAGGTVAYEYESTPGVPCMRNEVNCGDPEVLVVPVPPEQQSANQPVCERVWRSTFIDASPAVTKRTESDGTAASVRTYGRRSVAEREAGEPPYKPDFLRAVRVVVIGEPDGNGGRRSRRHVFRVDGGQEVLERIYASADGTGTPERTIVSCLGMWTDTFETCGTFESVNGAKKISSGGGTGRLMRSVTWYGANPSFEESTVPTPPMTFTAGASCADFPATEKSPGPVCLQKTASGWNEAAREYSIWTTEKVGTSGALFPTDFVRRVETTAWNADVARWDLKRPGSKSLKDEYNDGGNTCPERHAPCETKTSFEYAANGFLTKAALGDVAGAAWKLETEYEQDGTSGNVKKETKTVRKNGILQPDLGYAIGRSYQYGQVVLSRWLNADGTELLKRFDVTRDGNTGWITSSRDPAGLQASYGYDALGRLTSVTAPGETETQTYCYAVNPPGLKPYVLVKKGGASACGLTESGTGPFEAYQYDRLGRLERKIKRYPDAAVTGTGMKFGVQKTSYALSGDVIFASEWADCGTGTPTTPGGTDVSECFTATPLAGTSYGEFDALGRGRRETAADGYTVKRTYGPTVAISATDVMEWRERRKTNKDDKTESQQRYAVSAKRVNAFGQLAIAVEPAFVAAEGTEAYGPMSFLYYNALGKLSQAQDNGSASTAPVTSMPVAEAADAYIQKRTWRYDASGLLKQETHPEKTGAVEYLAYDALGNVKEKTDGGIWSGYEYDRAGRLTKEKASTTGTATGAVPLVTNSWDTVMMGKLGQRRGWNPSGEARYGNSVLYWPGEAEKAPPGLTVMEEFGYSSTSGKMTSRTVTPEMEAGTVYRRNGAVQARETFTYDAASGDLTGYLHPGNAWGLGLTETRSYKAGLQIAASVKTTEMGSAMTAVSGVSYGPSGAVRSYTLGNGSSVQITLDARNRPTLISGGGFNSEGMTYDGEGNIAKVGTRTYVYDANSRLTKVQEPGANETPDDWETMTYDRWGNMTSRYNGWTGVTESLPVFNATNRLQAGTYDSRGNLLAISGETFWYDVKGRKHEYEASGTKMRYLYDGGDERVVKAPAEIGSTPVTRRQMARIVVEALGLAPKTSCQTPSFGDVPCTDPDWGYIQRMYEIGITSGCGSGNFCPDNSVLRQEMAVFVMRTKYYDGVSVPPVVPNPTVNPAWTDNPAADPNMLRFINRAYEDGITAGCSATPLKFCPWNQTLGWEIELFVTRARPRTVVIKPSAAYILRDPGNRVVTEYQDTVRKRDNIYLGHQLVSSLTYTWNAPSKTWTTGFEYYASDHLGTPRAATNQYGGLLEAKDYLAYGELRTGLPSAQRKSFALMERDDEGFGKSFFDHARDYHSRLGRFTSPDQLQGRPEDPQSWNRYTYARNNPLRYVDPDGNAPQFFGVALSVIAREAAIGATVNVALNAGINHLEGRPLLENAGREAFLGAAIGAGTPMGVGLATRFFSRFREARLIGQLVAQGVKHNADDIVRIAANAEGKVVFLEKGGLKAGLEHILTQHGDDFARAGIPREKVADAVMQAATKGKVIGYQGSGTGRPILEYTFEGKLYRMAVTVGDNGFVVGANPVR